MYDLELITELEGVLEGFGESRAPKEPNRQMFAEVTEIKKQLDRAVRNANKAMKKADYVKAIDFCDEGIDAANAFKDSIADMTDAEIQTYHGVGTKATLQALLGGMAYAGISAVSSKINYNKSEDAILRLMGSDGNEEDKRNVRKGFNVGLGVGGAAVTVTTGGLINIIQRIRARIKTKKLNKASIIADIDTVIEALNVIKKSANSKMKGTESFAVDVDALLEALSDDGSVLKGLTSCGISDDVACEMYIDLMECYSETE